MFHLLCYCSIARLVVYANGQFLEEFHYKSYCFLGLASTKKLKFPTFGDIVPMNFCNWRSNKVTLWCRRPQETPRHWQKCMLSFQELITPSRSSLILALNSGNVNGSLSLFLPTIEVRNKPKHQRRINVCMEKDENGGVELKHEKSPMQCVWKCFCLTNMLKWLCMVVLHLKKKKIYNMGNWRRQLLVQE